VGFSDDQLSHSAHIYIYMVMKSKHPSNSITKHFLYVSMKEASDECVPGGDLLTQDLDSVGVLETRNYTVQCLDHPGVQMHQQPRQKRAADESTADLGDVRS
jgi:hypothetical protein